MKTRYEVFLNDISLSSLNDNLAITDISYPAPSIEHSVSQYAGRDGGYVSGSRKSEAVVAVSIELHIYNTQERQAACQEIISWAKNGGKLQTSDRVDQYIQCVCTKIPSIESALKWTDTLTVEFAAYAIPYWQSEFASEAALSGTDASGVVFVPGNGKTRADVKITASAALSSITVGFGSASITLSGLNVSAGDVIAFSHDENGTLYIKQGTVSLLLHRTPASSDDLEADCGTIPISITASSSVEAVFSAKGVWN